MNIFRSATFKLTVWYLALVMVISIGFSVALYNVATRELHQGLNRESQRIFRQFTDFNRDPNYPGPPPELAYSSQRLKLRLVAFNMIVLVGAGFVSYGLARRSLRPIEEAHEQQKRFTADVSHELRTPLTAIRMESEVALIDPKAPAKELRSTLASNLEEVGRLEALINNLLRLSQLEAGELQQSFQPIDNQFVIAEALQNAQKIAEAKHISLVDKSKQGHFSGDPESIVQVLTILLDNAIKYSPLKSTVTITSKRVNRQVQINVVDEGRGIDKKSLDNIFDRFYRGDSSRTKDADSNEGFGLGLSIAKQIADIHNATITLKSQPGKGTTAQISFPVAAE